LEGTTEVASDFEIATKLVESQAASAIWQIHRVADAAVGQDRVGGSIIRICDFKPTDSHFCDRNLAGDATVRLAVAGAERAGFHVTNLTFGLAVGAATFAPPDATFTRPTVGVQVTLLEAIDVGARVAELAEATAAVVGDANLIYAALFVNQAFHRAGEGDAVGIHAGFATTAIVVGLTFLVGHADVGASVTGRETLLTVATIVAVDALRIFNVAWARVRWLAGIWVDSRVVRFLVAAGLVPSRQIAWLRDVGLRRVTPCGEVIYFVRPRTGTGCDQ